MRRLRRLRFDGLIRRTFIRLCAAGFVPPWVWDGVARACRSHGRPLEGAFIEVAFSRQYRKVLADLEDQAFFTGLYE